MVYTMPTDDILQGFTINLYSDGLLKQFFCCLLERYEIQVGFIENSCIGSKLPTISSDDKNLIWMFGSVLFIALQYGL